jgi:hypothetical protein
MKPYQLLPPVFFLFLFTASYAQKNGGNRVVDPKHRIYVCGDHGLIFETPEQACKHVASDHIKDGYKYASHIIADNGPVKCICKKNGAPDNDQQGIIMGQIVCPKNATEIIDETPFLQKKCECPTPGYNAGKCKCQPALIESNEIPSSEKPMVTENELQNLPSVTPQNGILEQKNKHENDKDVIFIDKATIASSSKRIDAATNPNLQTLFDQLIDAAATNPKAEEVYTNQMKGEMGENIAEIIGNELEGYEYYPTKLFGGTGIDVLMIKGCLDDPEGIIVIEAKMVYNEVILMSIPGKGPQMSEQWMENTIREMKSGRYGPARKQLGEVLEKNKSKIQKYVIAADRENKQAVILKLGTY